MTPRTGHAKNRVAFNSPEDRDGRRDSPDFDPANGFLFVGTAFVAHVGGTANGEFEFEVASTRQTDRGLFLPSRGHVDSQDGNPRTRGGER